MSKGVKVLVVLAIIIGVVAICIGGSNLVKGNKISKIDNVAMEVMKGEVKDSVEASIGEDIGGSTVKEFLTFFSEEGIDALAATVEVRKDMVEIIFASDFLDNQIFIFDDAGKLMLYKAVSNGVGGEARYYFKNGKNIAVQFDYDEEAANENAKAEDTNEILERSKLVYETYLK